MFDGKEKRSSTFPDKVTHLQARGIGTTFHLKRQVSTAVDDRVSPDLMRKANRDAHAALHRVPGPIPRQAA